MEAPDPNRFQGATTKAYRIIDASRRSNAGIGRRWRLPFVNTIGRAGGCAFVVRRLRIVSNTRRFSRLGSLPIAPRQGAAPLSGHPFNCTRAAQIYNMNPHAQPKELFEAPNLDGRRFGNRQNRGLDTDDPRAFRRRGIFFIRLYSGNAVEVFSGFYAEIMVARLKPAVRC